MITANGGRQWLGWDPQGTGSPQRCGSPACAWCCTCCTCTPGTPLLPGSARKRMHLASLDLRRKILRRHDLRNARSSIDMVGVTGSSPVKTTKQKPSVKAEGFCFSGCWLTRPKLRLDPVLDPVAPIFRGHRKTGACSCELHPVDVAVVGEQVSVALVDHGGVGVTKPASYEDV